MRGSRRQLPSTDRKSMKAFIDCQSRRFTCSPFWRPHESQLISSASATVAFRWPTITFILSTHCWHERLSWCTRFLPSPSGLLILISVISMRHARASLSVAESQLFERALITHKPCFTCWKHVYRSFVACLRSITIRVAFWTCSHEDILIFPLSHFTSWCHGVTTYFRILVGMVSKPLIMWSFSSYSKLDAERTRGISDGMRYVEKIEVKTLSEFVFQCSKPRICGGIIPGIEVLSLPMQPPYSMITTKGHMQMDRDRKVYQS